MICVCGCGRVLSGRQKKYAGGECAKTAARAAWIWNVYGLSTQDYDAILAYQKGGCAICGKKPGIGKHLPIDHEHGGQVRGLLCGYCNLRLVGRLKSPERAQKLADYLRWPPAAAALGRVVIAPGRPRRRRQPRKRQR